MWFKLVYCPFCGSQRRANLTQKRCKCTDCGKYYDVR